MKNAAITLSYDEEKVTALKLYLEQKDSTVEVEMGKALDALYAKTVPAGVRDFIGMRSGNAAQTVPKAKKPKPSKQPEHSSLSAVGASGKEEASHE